MPSLCEKMSRACPSLTLSAGLHSPYEKKIVSSAEYIPFSTMIKGIMAQSSRELFNSDIAPVLSNLIDFPTPPEIEVRGSIIPLSICEQKGSLTSKALDNSVTNLMKTHSPLLGSPSSQFARNVDINIDAQTDEQMNDISSILKSIPGVNEYKLRPFLNQYTFPGIPSFFINVNTPFVLDPKDASKYASTLNFHNGYWGRHADRDYAISSKMHAARGSLVKYDGTLQVEIDKENSGLLLNQNIPDYFLTDYERTPSMMLADLARNARFQSLVLGIDQVNTSLASVTNSKEILLAFQQHLANGSSMVVNNEDSATIKANYLPLLLLYPEAFAQFIKKRPFAFAACRYIHTDGLSTEKVARLMSVGQSMDLDLIVASLYEVGIIDKAEIGDAVAKLVLKTDYSRLIETMQDEANPYKAKSIDSLLTLFHLFDTHDPITGKMFPFNESYFQNIGTHSVAFRSV